MSNGSKAAAVIFTSGDQKTPSDQMKVMKGNLVVVIASIPFLFSGCSLREQTVEFAKKSATTMGAMNEYYDGVRQSDVMSRKTAHSAYLWRMPQDYLNNGLSVKAGISSRKKLVGALDKYAQSLAALGSEKDETRVAAATSDITTSLTNLAGALPEPGFRAASQQATQIFGNVLGEIVTGHFRYLQTKAQRDAIIAANDTVRASVETISGELTAWGLFEEALWDVASDNEYVFSTGMGGTKTGDDNRDENFDRMELYDLRSKTALSRVETAKRALTAFSQAHDQMTHAILDNKEQTRQALLAALRTLSKDSDALVAAVKVFSKDYEGKSEEVVELGLPPEAEAERVKLTASLTEMDKFLKDLVETGAAEEMMRTVEGSKQVKLFLIRRNSVQIAIAHVYVNLLKGSGEKTFRKLVSEMSRVQEQIDNSQKALNAYVRKVENVATVIKGVEQLNEDTARIIHLVSNSGAQGLDISRLGGS